jgi:hypothetical protein
MRRSLLVCLLLCFSISVLAQSDDQEARIEKVQIVVGTLVTDADKATVLFTDLTQVTGHVTSFEQTWFILSDGRKRSRNVKIRYSDVLAITSKKASVSFVPDPATRPYGSWADLSSIQINGVAEVHLKNGEIKVGRYRSNTNDVLTLADVNKVESLMLLRDEIAFVFRFKKGVLRVSEGMAGGTSKGANAGRTIGTGKGKPFASAIGSAIGAVAGATKGSLDHTDSLKVLIYSQ